MVAEMQQINTAVKTTVENVHKSKVEPSKEELFGQQVAKDLKKRYKNHEHCEDDELMNMNKYLARNKFYFISTKLINLYAFCTLCNIFFLPGNSTFIS
jgi:hypothetical protein